MGRRVELGRVAGPFGVRGWVRVRSYTEPAEQIIRYSPWWVATARGELRLEVEQGARHGRSIVVRLAGCADRESAAALAGAVISVDREQLPPAAAGEVYWTDLIGLQVSNLSGEHLGRVVRLLDTGANDVLVVRDARGECLIPWLRERVVKVVDLEGGTLTVDWEREF